MSTRRNTVLVADDHAIVKEGLVSLLKEHDFDVVGAVGDGQLLIEEARRLRPDVIVTDLAMPKLSGLDVLRKIREQEKFKSLPCIILTAGGDAKHERDALALGATHFLTKPFSPKKLYALVARLTGTPDEAGLSGE
ncbi:MAG: response regulator [Gemmatimonadaceae bacterium]